jgi:MFS family permease
MFSLSSSPGSLYNVSWQAFFSDIVPPDLRNSFLTLRTKVSLFTGTLVVLSTGLLLSYLPRNDGDRIALYQGFYVVAFLASFLQIAYLRRVRGGDKPWSGDAARRRFRTTMRSLLQNRPFLGFAAISLLLYVGWQLSWPLFFITQVRYLHANEAWLSWISIVSSLLNLATTGFWSRYIDRRGVRWTLVVGSFGMALNPALFAVSTFVPAPYALPSLLLLNSVVGLTFTAFQLSSIQCLLEVLGENDKTLQISIFTSMTLVSNILSPMAGVWLYTTLGSDRRALALSMLASTLLRILATLAFGYRWWRLRGTPDSGMRLTSTP